MTGDREIQGQGTGAGAAALGAGAAATGAAWDAPVSSTVTS